MSEIDISNKIKWLIKFGLPALLVLAVGVSSLVWYTMYGTNDLVVKDARVSSSMVIARARAAGSVSEVLVKDGDVVKAGDVLARIKVNVTDEQLKQLEQNVELSKRNLEQVKKGVTVQIPRAATTGGGGASSAEIERARSRMERMNQLYEMGAISAIKRDEAAAEYQALAASAAPASSAVVAYDTTVQAASPEVIKQAELHVRQAQAALDNAKGNAAATEITAPVDGTVYVGELAEGDEVQPGQPLASIGNAENMWVEVQLSPEQSEQVRLGQAVDYYVDRVKYHGLVIDITEPNAEASAAQDNTEGGELPVTTDYVVKISIASELMDKFQFGNRVEVRFLQKG